MRLLAVGVAVVMAAIGTSPVRAAEETPAEKQSKLLAVLRSDAPPGEKAVTCKLLAVYGTDEAVPVLAPLLLDERLNSWARIALEAIPGPVADNALRDALAKVQGRRLVGVINSIGYRRDAMAVGPLAAKIKDSDADVASAAAVALGKIGGNPAAKILRQYLAKAPEAVRPAVAEGCIRCAEKYLADGKNSSAVTLYEAVRKAQVPKQKVLEATRGTILARQAKGIPLLMEQLRSPDQAFFGIGLRTARELQGAAATKAIAAELHNASLERQPLVLLALADRKDPAALPTILEAARNGAVRLRVAAVSVLERFGGVASVPVLLDAATSDDKELSQTAMLALTRLQGSEVDAELLKRLPESPERTRQALLELAGRRGLEQAIPAVMLSVENASGAVRAAALQTVGILGAEPQAADLARLLLKTRTPAERTELETPLLAISGRRGSGCVPSLLPLTQSDSSALRLIGLRACAAAGGPEALTAVKTALQDQDDNVQNEAVRTLSTWPNTWPEDSAVAEPLLGLVKSAVKVSHQVLAARGYLQYLQADKKLKDEEKVGKVNELLVLLKRPEEKRLAVSALRAIPTAATLDSLTKLATEPGVAGDAYSALYEVASKKKSPVAKEARQKALQIVAEKATDDDLKKKAAEALKKVE